ncbi:MAG TPA: argininosuccinate lyase [Verrucomicrobiales bacterium]|nr:argininosuccinate lyase [Verrucomicrobiales bacterium]
MWKGRFASETAELVRRFGESVSFDHRLFRQDIRASIAHARALRAAGLLSLEELESIETGLREIETEIAEGRFPFQTSLEDLHMNIESALTARIGEAGARLHSARSRNDQISVDTRLYCRDEIDRLSGRIRNFQQVLVDIARREIDTMLPGYTHLQRGQPVLLSHHLLAYVEMLDRDRDRLAGCRTRLNVLPLGSGALAGSTILLDRDAIARELGFDAISSNSMDAVSDRDFVAEILFSLALLGTHLSRLSEDVILWNSAEFGFIHLSDAYTTGSSLMPQKKNPDVAELTRGKTGRLYGNLVAVLTMLKGLPMTYNRDLQEDKAPLFDSFDTANLILEVFAAMLTEAAFDRERMHAAAADPLLLATDLAEALVQRGLPFRQAHEVVGRLTAHALDQGRSFREMQPAEFQEFSSLFGDDVLNILDPRNALAARDNPGCPAPQRVRAEIARWEQIFSVETQA